MRALPPPSRGLVIAFLCYAAIAVSVGMRRGGDLELLLGEARLWIERAPLYAANPRVGVWWPPLAVACVVPFALLAQASLGFAKAAWALASLAALAWTLTRLPEERWRPVLLAVGAVALPIHRNFEDLNLNAILLALVVAAALDLDARRDGRAGVWIGLAGALKMFPALLLLYVAVRGRWRAFACGALTGCGASLLALLPYGPSGAVRTIAQWIAHSAPAGWALLGSNQSLAALASRLHLSAAGVVVLDAACVALAVLALRRPRVTTGAFDDVAVVTLVAVLLSPIAWVHYFTLALPAWVVALRLRLAERRTWRGALVLAAIATSGVLTVWSLSWRARLFELSLYTWGALLLLTVLACAPPAAYPAASAALGTDEGRALMA